MIGLIDWRKPAAEFLGTAFLLTAIVGSGIMAERLSGGNSAVALLANAVATGAALFALIHIFGPISGAHFNPAVTLALALARETPREHVLPYVLAQLGGAVAGVWIAHLMFDLPILQTSAHTRTGVGQWTGEIVATCGLLAVIASGKRHFASALPSAIAMYIVAAYWFTSSTSFANPAVTMARSLTDTFAGIAPANVTGFIIAQALGAGAGLLVARMLGFRYAFSTTGSGRSQMGPCAKARSAQQFEKPSDV
ncbi:MAG TPA: MIP/aquaporin family protein [Alphaproteobacteria bacterium]|nr:MIP/aquaporin family protein [Alphaproteobacteria bacterium]